MNRMQSKVPAIEFRGVRMAFGEKVVLHNIDLTVSPGEIVALVGPSGCGKTTLMKLAYGSNRPTEGEVLVNGEPVRHINRGCGMVYQSYRLFRNLTVLENVAIGRILGDTNLAQRVLSYFHLSPHFKRVRRAAEEEAREWIKEVGLKPGDADKYPHELSGGMRQRVAIARAMLINPLVVMMDEVFSALDPIIRKDVGQMILNVQKNHGTTVMLVSHMIEEAVLLGTRVIALSQYWTYNDGRPSDGAMIVYDRAIPDARERPADWRFSTEFTGHVQSIDRDAMQPSYCQPVKEFNLTHPDSHPARVR